MTAPHETDAFRNSDEYTISITFRVEGAARWQTAQRRAQRIAERLANHAARAAHVVEVTAVGGASHDGQPAMPRRICFDEANTGRGTNAEPDKLDRYLDPTFRRALDSLATANAASRARAAADRARRRDLDCRNAEATGMSDEVACPCLYCSPRGHDLTDRLDQSATSPTQALVRCPCGDTVDPGLRCGRHRGVELVVLDGDPPELARAAGHLALPEPRVRLRAVGGPDLSPLGR